MRQRLWALLRRRWLRLTLALFLLLWILPALILPMPPPDLLLLWQGLLLSGVAALSIRCAETAWLREQNREAERQQHFNWLYSRLQPRRPLPAWEGNMAEPTLLVAAVEVLLERPSPRVLELGSGLSTLVMALALERNGGGELVALEHNPQYAAYTRQMLADHGLEGRARVLDVPLQTQQFARQRYRWYSLQAVGELADVDLLFVDGPPDIQKRSPALPMLHGLLADAAVILVDDTNRPAGRRMLECWLDRFPRLVRSTIYEGERWTWLHWRSKTKVTTA